VSSRHVPSNCEPSEESTGNGGRVRVKGEEMPVTMIRYKCEGVRDINQMQFDRAREMREDKE